MKSYLLVFLCAILGSCVTSRKLSNSNIAYSYKEQVTNMHPQFLIYHSSDSLSEFHFKLNNKDIKLIKNKFKIAINIEQYNSYEESILIDSSSFVISDSMPAISDLVGNYKFPCKANTRGVLKITTRDLYGNKKSTSFIDFDKTNKSSRQFYLPLNAETKTPLFQHIISDCTAVEVKSRNKETELLVKYYNPNFSLPVPPFSVYSEIQTDYEPNDLLYTQNNNGIFSLDVKNTGFYFITVDADSKEGLTLFNFGDDFPEITDIRDAIEPLRFITSKKEFNELSHQNPDTLRMQFEQFWLKNNSDPDKVRNLIRHYYHRLELANTHFSSFKPGWKTDRGMIYLIFGPPNVVYRNSKSESWVYGEENNYMSINFVFNKSRNPISDNHYVLNRSSIYKIHWYRAVDSWRQGKVYFNN